MSIDLQSLASNVGSINGQTIAGMLLMAGVAGGGFGAYKLIRTVYRVGKAGVLSLKGVPAYNILWALGLTAVGNGVADIAPQYGNAPLWIGAGLSLATLGYTKATLANANRRMGA